MTPTRSALTLAVERLLLATPCESAERAIELLARLSGRGVYVPALSAWLERCRAAFPESISVEVLDGLHDHGVDILLSGLSSGHRVGFQVKSDRDLKEKDFTVRLKAQLVDSEYLGLDLMVLVFACQPTRRNIAIAHWWQDYCRGLARSVICMVPGRAAALLVQRDGVSVPLAPARGSWAAFFHVVERPELAPVYLDAWQGLEPDERFLPPKELGEIRQALTNNCLVFVVGPPAFGKTFTALQLLWEAYSAGRPVSWVTANEVEPTDGPIPLPFLDAGERAGFRRRVEAVLRTLGSDEGRLPDRHAPSTFHRRRRLRTRTYRRAPGAFYTLRHAHRAI
jgi:hypothetical protein